MENGSPMTTRRSRIPFAALALAALLFSGGCSGAENETFDEASLSPRAAEAFDRLVETDHGFWDTVEPGLDELALYALWDEGVGPEVLVALAFEARGAGKLYAMAGLHRTHPERRATVASELAENGTRFMFFLPGDCALGLCVRADEVDSDWYAALENRYANWRADRPR